MPPSAWSAEDFAPVAGMLRGHPWALAHGLELVRARLQARLRAEGIGSFGEFFERELRGRVGGPGMQVLIDVCTINHTAFFREPETLDLVADALAARLAGAPSRAWSAGCSGGQEPYSLAILLAERLAPPALARLEIEASDVALGMVRGGARGVYSRAEVAPARLRRHFLRGRGPRAGSVRVAPEIRRMVRFRHHDLRDPAWPVADSLDAILCRNTAIYFAEPDRITLLRRLAESLRPGGLLAVGRSEILGALPPALEPAGPSLYRRVAP